MEREMVVVLTTLPAGDGDEPARLARTLVDERLAACVNVHAPMSSIYRWNNAVERAEERQIVIKTTRARLAALEDRIRALHPYELPELLVLPAAGSAAYTEWVEEAVAGKG